MPHQILTHASLPREPKLTRTFMYSQGDAACSADVTETLYVTVNQAEVSPAMSMANGMSMDSTKSIVIATVSTYSESKTAILSVPAGLSVTPYEPLSATFSTVSSSSTLPESMSTVSVGPLPSATFSTASTLLESTSTVISLGPLPTRK